MVSLKQIVAAITLSTLVIVSYAPAVRAADATSTNYGVSQVNFSSGGMLQTCSASFCSKQAIGELAVGATSSTNYRVQSGANVDREPFLEVIVPGGTVDLGILDETVVSSGSTTFSVKSYLAWGYVVLIDGTAPTNPTTGHVLTPMTVAGVSQPGTEQFGINLRANTSPSVGSDPVQLPDSSFSFGAATAGYDTANNFKFNGRDKIAESTQSSGTTNYTMSAIGNIGTTSPGGKYAGRLSVIVVPTF